jgi:hypothetical protein
MSMTRRELGIAAVGLAAAGEAEAQAPAADLAQVVREGNRRSAEALAQFSIPISTEPAVRFEA